MPFNDYLKFGSAFIKNPSVIGAIAPSSQHLCRAMLEWIEWDNVQAVIEYGPGTGVFTESIVSLIRPDAIFLAVEIDADFAQALMQRFPEICIYQDSVGNIEAICKREGIRDVDAIVSGLPWSVFSEKEQDRYLDAMFTVLRPGGQFVTFAYLQGLLLRAGKQFQSRLQQTFTEVTYSKTVWRNLPPAFVYRCRR